MKTETSARSLASNKDNRAGAPREAEPLRNTDDLPEFFAMATEAANLGYWVVDLETYELWWSDEIYRIHGLSPERYRPDVASAVAFYHPDDVGAVEAMLDRVVATGGRESFDLRIVRPSGETRHVRSIATYRPADDNSNPRIIGTFRDTTYEAVTAGVRSQLDELNSMFHLDGTSRIRRLLEICRWVTDADAAGIWFGSSEPTTADDAAYFVRLASEAPVGACFAVEPIDCGTDELCVAGFYSAVSGREIGDVQRTLTRLLIRMINYEMAARAQIEELEAARQTLAIREQELALIFDTVPVRIWYKDDQNRILRLNQPAAESMGMSVHDAEGANAYDLFPEMAAKYHKDDLDIIESRRPRFGIVERYTPRDGAEGWLRTDKIPFKDPVAGKLRLLVVAQDITDLMQAQQLLKRRTRELELANQQLDEFAYLASHDLRAPMRGISQLATWLAEDNADTLGEESHQALTLLTRRVARIDQMLLDILTYSRSGREMAQPEYVDCLALIDEIRTDCNFPDSFAISVDPELPDIHAPQAGLRHIFTNLIDNAIKHHDRDAGSIRISAEHRGDAVVLHIADDGPGIPHEFQDRVFRMFETLVSRDAVEGSGIGLSICRRLARAMGGDITVTSAQHRRGTCFSVQLPQQAQSLPDADHD
ncbi:MAG: ATP-binding protein [Pseudomonadota bacterium]